MAVQMISSRVLPWIGGPSISSSPGRMRNFHTENSTTVSTITKTGIEAISRTSHSVSTGLACLEACSGNQSMRRPAAMPRMETTTPMASIWRQSARACGRSTLSGADAMRPESYASAPTNAALEAPGRRPADTLVPVLGGAICRAQAVRERTERRCGAPAGPEVRRRHPLVAAERLGELGGLAVADPVGDLADGERPGGEHLGGLLHPDLGQVVAERGLADLRVGALELTAGRGHAAGDVVQGERGRELAVDDLRGLVEQRGPQADG